MYWTRNTDLGMFVFNCAQLAIRQFSRYMQAATTELLTDSWRMRIHALWSERKSAARIDWTSEPVICFNVSFCFGLEARDAGWLAGRDEEAAVRNICALNSGSRDQSPRARTCCTAVNGIPSIKLFFSICTFQFLIRHVRKLSLLNERCPRLHS